jgi:hypothetical protein
LIFEHLWRSLRINFKFPFRLIILLAFLKSTLSFLFLPFVSCSLLSSVYRFLLFHYSAICGPLPLYPVPFCSLYLPLFCPLCPVPFYPLYHVLFCSLLPFLFSSDPFCLLYPFPFCSLYLFSSVSFPHPFSVTGFPLILFTNAVVRSHLYPGPECNLYPLPLCLCKLFLSVFCFLFFSILCILFSSFLCSAFPFCPLYPVPFLTLYPVPFCPLCPASFSSVSSSHLSAVSCSLFFIYILFTSAFCTLFPSVLFISLLLVYILFLSVHMIVVYHIL